MKITAIKWNYQQAHSDELISTRIVPVPPYDQQDIHDQFQQLLDTVIDFGNALVRDGHYTNQQFLDQNFKWNPIKKRVKGQALKQRVKFVGNRDKLRHQDRTIYTVADILHMIQNKVNHTLPNTKELAHFTEAMLNRTNKALTYFSLLAEKYYGKGSHWAEHLPAFKIEIDWIKEENKWSQSRNSTAKINTKANT